MISILIAGLYFLILLCIVVIYIEVLEVRKTISIVEMRAEELDRQIKRLTRVINRETWNSGLVSREVV